MLGSPAQLLPLQQACSRPAQLQNPQAASQKPVPPSQQHPKIVHLEAETTMAALQHPVRRSKVQMQLMLQSSIQSHQVNRSLQPQAMLHLQAVQHPAVVMTQSPMG